MKQICVCPRVFVSATSFAGPGHMDCCQFWDSGPEYAAMPCPRYFVYANSSHLLFLCLCCQVREQL